jgi:outer membrane protein assembly factor BamB
MATLTGSALALAATAASLATSSPASAVESSAAISAVCVRHAYAAEVGFNGKTIWRTPMAATSQELQTAFSPAIGATVGYWPEDGAVHALRLKDGKELWHYQQGFSLNGAWLNHGVVSVLTDDFGGDGVLSGLNATTGKLTWRVKIPGKGLTIGGPVATADGGLAWVRADGQLQVVDLTTGKIRWSARQGTAAQIATQFPQLMTVGKQIFYLAAGRLSAYLDTTGAVSWSLHKMPVHTTLEAGAGEVLLNGGWPGGPYAIGALDPVKGGVLWHFDAATPLALLASTPGHIAVAAESGPVPLHEFMLDATTGLATWQTDTQLLGNPVVIRAADTIAVEGNGDYDKPALLVDRSLVDGHILWQTTLHHQAATGQSLTVVGTTVVINPDPEFANPDNPLFAYSLANGHPAWTATTFLPLQAGPVLTKKAMLLTSASDPDIC